MNCPTTGEICFYRTQLAKVGDTAAFNASMGDDINITRFCDTVRKVFKSAVDTPEQAPCAENYCAALGIAVVDGLLFRAQVEHTIRTEGKT